MAQLITSPQGGAQSYCADDKGDDWLLSSCFIARVKVVQHLGQGCIHRQGWVFCYLHPTSWAWVHLCFERSLDAWLKIKPNIFSVFLLSQFLQRETWSSTTNDCLFTYQCVSYSKTQKTAPNLQWQNTFCPLFLLIEYQIKRNDEL